ncbi:unnamed protein product [Arabis nemorensis]|uniref:Uncharacterized protein n=1 Tax=Arabis nemorensis TaxID=586526 RepID=A0A565CM60_9BRAS|nr:unnamed protein product [Arabis nemorensis]
MDRCPNGIGPNDVRSNSPEYTTSEHKDSHCLMVIEESRSLDSSKVTLILEKGTNDDDPPKIDYEKTQDEKNF